MKAMIFDIQHASYVDGPGLRTTVFFKGCHLNCKWCHNPESQNPEPQLMFYQSACTGCGTCAKICPHSLRECDLCGKCADYCPHDARRLCGCLKDVDEVFDQILSDRAYYKASGGGVTCSGGECLLQPDFLLELLTQCKEAGIHTAVDTAGAVPWNVFQRILPVSDLFLYDLKCVSEGLHRQGTGASNRLILENLKKLAPLAPVTVRVPLIPGFNDSEKEVAAMRDFLRELPYQSLEVLPYHAMGEHKYAALGRVVTRYAVPSPEQVDRFTRLLRGAVK